MKSFEFTVRSELGLHARPAGILAKLAKTMDSEVTLFKGEKSASVKKLLALMSLCVKCGDTVRIEVSGGSEQENFDKIKAFFEENF